MAETRHKDSRWIVSDSQDSSNVSSWDQIQCAILMDIRDELQRLNRLLHCGNFQAIPRHLSRIQLNTNRKKKVAKR